MTIELVPLGVFVTVATFTPGPGNIASAAMGMMFGFRSSLRFLVGIVLGYLCIMLLSAFVAREVMAAMPGVEPYLRAFGVCYLLWLAFGILRATYSIDSAESRPMAFMHGFWLQVLNPKAVIFGLTLYTTFFASLAAYPAALALSAGVLACVTLASVSLWAFVGTRIGRLLHIAGVRNAVNAILAMLLVYCALALSGIWA